MPFKWRWMSLRLSLFLWGRRYESSCSADISQSFSWFPSFVPSHLSSSMSALHKHQIIRCICAICCAPWIQVWSDILVSTDFWIGIQNVLQHIIINTFSSFDLRLRRFIIQYWDCSKLVKYAKVACADFLNFDKTLFYKWLLFLKQLHGQQRPRFLLKEKK